MFVAALALLWAAPARAEDLPDFDALWNYSDPAGTEAKFRELLPKAEASGDQDYLGRLLTQIARTHSLRAQFDEAHRLLDRVEKLLTPERKVLRMRYLLERGRTFNSSKQTEKALALFREAWDFGVANKIEGYACDAGHMLAYAQKGDAALEWDLKTLAYAEQSQDPAARRWLGTLYNNIGWTLHAKGEHAKALELFQKDLAFRLERKRPVEARMAKWGVGRALRSLGRLDEALVTQRELEKECEAAAAPDGYVFEELGEILLAQGKPADAKPNFARAFALLERDPDVAGDAPRLERLRTLGGLPAK